MFSRIILAVVTWAVLCAMAPKILTPIRLKYLEKYLLTKYITIRLNTAPKKL